ncbi:unnamed protein product, partial [Larinioides sclopetarius]
MFCLQHRFVNSSDSNCRCFSKFAWVAIICFPQATPVLLPKFICRTSC